MNSTTIGLVDFSLYNQASGAPVDANIVRQPDISDGSVVFAYGRFT